MALLLLGVSPNTTKSNEYLFRERNVPSASKDRVRRVCWSRSISHNKGCERIIGTVHCFQPKLEKRNEVHKTRKMSSMAFKRDERVSDIGSKMETMDEILCENTEKVKLQEVKIKEHKMHFDNIRKR